MLPGPGQPRPFLESALLRSRILLSPATRNRGPVLLARRRQQTKQLRPRAVRPVQTSTFTCIPFNFDCRTIARFPAVRLFRLSDSALTCVYLSFGVVVSTSLPLLRVRPLAKFPIPHRQPCATKVNKPGERFDLDKPASPDTAPRLRHRRQPEWRPN